MARRIACLDDSFQQQRMRSTGSPTPLRTIRARGVDRRLRALKPEILALVESILDSGVIEKGPHVAALAREFQQLCHAPYQPVPCDSGTDALKMALLASGIGPGDEVLVPQLSFMSTASAVHEVGATPVFVDIEAEADTYAMSIPAAEAAITERTRAIVPVHLFGLPVDADAFLQLGQRFQLTIIGDAAQAHGASYKERSVGNLGFDFETFSLAAVKNMGGWRFGGIVTYRDPRMELLLHQLADLGRSPGESYTHSIHGLRATMDEFNAAIIRLQLAHLEAWNALRRQQAAEHDAAFADLAPALHTPVQLADRVSAYWQYCLRCESRALRDVLHASLRARGIETAHYPCVLSEQPAIKAGRKPYRVASSQAAEKAVGEQLWLPFWPEMLEEDRAYLRACVREVVNRGAGRRKVYTVV